MHSIRCATLGWSCSVLVLAGVAAAEPVAPAAAGPAAARVNGVPILDSEVEAALRQVRQAGAIPDERLGEVRAAILDQLIAVEVVTQAAGKAGVQVTDFEVEALLADLRRQAGGDEALPGAWGLELADLRAQIRRGLVAQRYLDMTVGPQVAVSDEEVRAYYEGNARRFVVLGRTRASHILCLADADPERRAAVRARCAGFLARVRAGEDFAAVAGEGSDCPSKEQGGDLGWLRSGQMVPELEAATASLAEGELAPDLVESRIGFHVLKFTGRQPESRRELAEVQASIREMLSRDRRAEKEQAHVAALVAAASIER